MAVRYIDGGTGENHWPAVSKWQTLSGNIVSSTLRTHNVSGDRHWLYRKLQIQLSYDHDHNGTPINKPIPEAKCININV